MAFLGIFLLVMITYLELVTAKPDYPIFIEENQEEKDLLQEKSAFNQNQEEIHEEASIILSNVTHSDEEPKSKQDILSAPNNQLNCRLTIEFFKKEYQILAMAFFVPFLNYMSVFWLANKTNISTLFKFELAKNENITILEDDYFLYAYFVNSLGTAIGSSLIFLAKISSPKGILSANLLLVALYYLVVSTNWVEDFQFHLLIIHFLGINFGFGKLITYYLMQKTEKISEINREAFFSLVMIMIHSGMAGGLGFSLIAVNINF